MTNQKTSQSRMSYYRDQVVCRACGAPLHSPFLNLGLQTFANNLVDAPYVVVPHAPLALVQCPDVQCQLVQLTVEVDRDVLFAEYLYTPSQSKTFNQHFNELAVELAVEGEGLWVDIGSNDGLLLSKVQNTRASWDVCGVEPCELLATQANDQDIPTCCDYWSLATAKKIHAMHGKADVVTATNVFAHVNKPVNFATLVEVFLLKDDGVFVIEVPYFWQMIQDNTFDLIYHEHQSYFSVRSLNNILSMANMYIENVELIPIHGGSLRVYARKGKRPETIPELLPLGPLGAWAVDVQQTRDRFVGVLNRYDYVVGYGAPAKATVLINYAQLTSQDIQYIVDDNPLKQGKYLPGSGIPVISREQVGSHPSFPPSPEAVIIFPWNIAKDIEPKVKSMFPGADIVVPQGG